nr:MAG TPA: hypothetical protein [Caudoviricetes sp.]
MYVNIRSKMSHGVRPLILLYPLQCRYIKEIGGF